MKIILGITGSIAAYKSLELIRLLKKNGHEVRVVMTRSALNFVTPLCCQTLSDNEVFIDQFVLTKGIKHLSLADWGEIMVIAPATANIIAKAAVGIGDDLLATTLLSFVKPVLFVPAMDEGMWLNAAVKNNIRILRTNGCKVMEPSRGWLASGKIGKGRFPPIEKIYNEILTIGQKHQALDGKKFLITGGRTEEDIDDVRVITNRASGKMAMELYNAVSCRGGSARLIIGCPSIPLPDGTNAIKVRTSAEMLYMLKRNVPWCDFLIMASAVGDYRPVKKSVSKVHASSFNLPLVKNRDMLKELSKIRKGRFFVGFSLEDKDELRRAKEKLRTKGLDIIVMNKTTAIGSDRTRAKILMKDGRIMNCGALSKWELANRIIDLCSARGR